MIFISLLYFFSNFVFSQNVDAVLEENIIGIKKTFTYIESNDVKFGDNLRKKYRIKFVIKNDTDTDITAVVFRYSLKIGIKKEGNTFYTIPFFSSSFRVSKLKKSSVKNVYVYEINNLIDEIKKYVNLGYTPSSINVDLMREPKKNQDFYFYSKEFPVYQIK